LRAGLLAHPLDDSPQLRVEAVRVEAARRLRDVHHEVCRPFELVHDAQHGDDRPQVGRHGLLAGEELVAAVLDRVGQVVDVVVVLDDLLGRREVGVEECLRAGGDRLGRQRREPDHADPQVVEGVLEALAGLVRGVRHGNIIPSRRTCLGRVRGSFGSFRQCSRPGHSTPCSRQDRARDAVRQRGLRESGGSTPNRSGTVYRSATSKPRPRQHRSVASAP
jgi:hypothetical protein